MLGGAALALIPRRGQAFDPFNLTYAVERSATGPIRVNGRVMNEGNVDVFDVYVSAEAVDGGGKVLGRGIAFVSPSIPPRGVVPFAIAIPAAPTATTFRVKVSSYRQGIGQQQAG